jgi:hypothetical protein
MLLQPVGVPAWSHGLAATVWLGMLWCTVCMYLIRGICLVPLCPLKCSSTLQCSHKVAYQNPADACHYGGGLHVLLFGLESAPAMKSAVFWAVFRCKHGLLSNALVSMAALALNYVEFLSGWQQAAAEKLLLTARTSALEKCCTACSQSLHFNCKFDSIWASLDAQSACLGRDSQRQTALVNVLPLVWPKLQSVVACQNAWAHSGLENHLVKSGKTGPSGTPGLGCCCI